LAREATNEERKRSYGELSRTDAAALGGEWYQSFVAKYEEAPGKPQLWEAEQWSIIDAMLRHAPDAVRARPRVSRDKQGRSGLGLEAQREAVTRYLNGGDWKLASVAAIKLKAQEHANNLREILDDVRAHGINCVREIAVELNRHGILPPPPGWEVDVNCSC
jgi:hypothetical protein